MTSRGAHPATLEPARLHAECSVRRGRRSGPGGQHRNKVETAIVLIHTPTGVRAEASERRSQHDNLQVALFRLRVNLALEFRTTIADETLPTDGWRARCQSRRLSINPRHDDFPAILAEALDYVTACGFDVRPAAQRLGVTASQLTRLLRLEPRALQLVNQHRQARGLGRLQ